MGCLQSPVWHLGLPAFLLVTATSVGFANGTSGSVAKRTLIVSSVDVSGGKPDADQVKALQAISDNAVKTGSRYYSRIISLLGAGKHPQAEKVTISFTYAYKGVAATGGDHMEVANDYALKRPNDIPGVIVHELAHVVQAYSKDTGYDTGWLTEGIADYVRWFNFEPKAKRPHPQLKRNPKATGSYQTTGAFLFWTVGKYDRNLVKKLNEAMYDGSYTPGIWKKLTGKTLEELNTEWVSTLSEPNKP